MVPKEKEIKVKMIMMIIEMMLIIEMIQDGNAPRSIECEKSEANQ